MTAASQIPAAAAAAAAQWHIGRWPYLSLSATAKSAALNQQINPNPHMRNVPVVKAARVGGDEEHPNPVEFDAVWETGEERRGRYHVTMGEQYALKWQIKMWDHGQLCLYDDDKSAYNLC